MQVHIDGHSDDNLPRYLSGMPFFHWPWTDLEVDLMLQQNDVFINVNLIFLKQTWKILQYFLCLGFYTNISVFLDIENYFL